MIADRIRALQTQLAAERKALIVQEQIERGIVSSANEHTKTQLEQLLAHPGIITLEYMPTTKHLFVVSNVITCVDDRTNNTHVIGHMLVDIDLTSVGIFRAQNLTWQVEGFRGFRSQAPHLMEQDNPCHGNVMETLQKAYRAKDLFGVIHIILTFLGSANTPDSAGATVNRWPYFDPITGVLKKTSWPLYAPRKNLYIPVSHFKEALDFVLANNKLLYTELDLVNLLKE